MVRTGSPTVADLMAQLAAHAAEIAALKAEKEALSQHVVRLEEELARTASPFCAAQRKAC
jgi:transposase